MLNILLIQDNLLMKTDAKNILSHFGHVDEINDGLESVNKLFIVSNANKLNYDVIFIDVILTRMSGISVLYKIREYEKKYNVDKTPIILVQFPGHVLENDETLRQIADKIFTKPITEEMIREYFKEIHLI